MRNIEWITRIAREYKVSRTTAKEMLHAMYVAKELKNGNDAYNTYAESC